MLKGSIPFPWKGVLPFLYTEQTCANKTATVCCQHPAGIPLTNGTDILYNEGGKKQIRNQLRSNWKGVNE
jgi:hypothetical protein